jgi:3-dehydroquinate dehydratase II
MEGPLLNTTRTRVEVLHGVNLDMLGKRNPEHYGTLTLIELEVRIRHWARELGLEVSFFHTNYEGEFVERLHQAPEVADALLLNPGAWTHYSYAIRDAVEIADRPTVEVHLSDIGAREEWRRHSVLEELVVRQISGKGVDGYKEGLGVLARELGLPPESAA